MPFARSHIPRKQQLKLVATLLIVVSIVEVVNLILGRSLNVFGLVPREVSGAVGIITSPFLHGNLMHYVSNIVPLGVFAFLLLQHGAVRFWLVSFSIILLSGALVWVFGRSATHVGASGVIYGYFGYLVLAGFLSKEFKLLAISIMVTLVYAGLIWGVLPSSPYISWEGHLFGFIAGLLCATRWGKAITP